MDLLIITEKFGKKTIKELMDKETIIGNFNLLDEYNRAPYFSIKQFIIDGNISGYAVIFWGHNSIESTDASLEDIVYCSENYAALESFLSHIASHPSYPIPIKDIYYDPEKFAEISHLLDKAGFKRIVRNEERNSFSR